MGTLYVVATPIGNLGDLTERASKILKSVPLVIAEDTRVTRKLMARLAVSPRMVSCHGYTSPGRMREIVRLLDVGDAALVTDAGTPGINDPGAEIVAAAAKRGHRIVPLPGPSAIATALSVSGFQADNFISRGFIPSRPNSRRRAMQEIADDPSTTVFFETPHRIAATLKVMAEIFPERPIVICRELTKLHEEIWRGTSRGAVEHFTSPQGEFVVVVGPGPRESASDRSATDEEILAAARELADDAASNRDLVDAVASQTGANRRRVYQLIHGRTPSA